MYKDIKEKSFNKYLKQQIKEGRISKEYLKGYKQGYGDADKLWREYVNKEIIEDLNYLKISPDLEMTIQRLLKKYA